MSNTYQDKRFTSHLIVKICLTCLLLPWTTRKEEFYALFDHVIEFKVIEICLVLLGRCENLQNLRSKIGPSRGRESKYSIWLGSYSNLPNNRVGPNNCVGRGFLRN